MAPQAARWALIDERGFALLAVGSFPAGNLLAPFGAEPERAVGAGPGELLPETIAGLAPLTRDGRRHWLRVDLEGRRLAGQRRALRTLSWVVLPANAGVLLVVFFFLRQLLVPYETLLERARQVQPDSSRAEDEVTFLIDTFEQALAALAERSTPSPEDDIAALERTLGPSMESGLLLLDRQSRVLSLNPIGASLLGIPQPQPATELEEALRPHPGLLAILRRAQATGRPVQRQEVEIEASGATRTLGLTIHPLKRDDGSIRGALVLFADLTEARRRAEEEQITASLSQVGELAAGVAHEMRNSLATLRGYLTLIERAPGEESITDFLAEIRRESDHLQRVLEDFLSFARPGTTRLEQVDLASVAGRAAADPALGGFPVRVEAGDSARTTMKGDAQLLERAVRNLLHNAAQAERQVGRAGPLEVHLQESSEGLELLIEDRGPGIPEELRERLFQPFVTGRAGGVGLGLALARRIVDLHGGRLRFEELEGGGTRTVLHFPAGAIVT